MPQQKSWIQNLAKLARYLVNSALKRGRFPPSHPTLECGRRRGHFLGHLCCAAHYVRYKPQGHISIALGIHAGSHLGKCGLAAQKKR
ncbi:Uncharacterised protein [Vibrio cholerae]|nr:Uncharacterised protein [Vibrio cholerae]